MRFGQNLRSNRGFTLIEALVALAIGGFVIASLATVTGQWLLNWRSGFAVLQRSATLSAGLDRIAADLAAARFMPMSAAGPGVNFVGDDVSVTFVRRSLPVQTPAGLDLVQLAPQAGRGDVTLARSRSRLPFGSSPTVPTDRSPVILLRSPYQVRFSYADMDRRWRPTWRGLPRLPHLVRVEVVDHPGGRAILPPLVVALHVDAPAPCAFVSSAKACDAAMGLNVDQNQANAPTPSQAGGDL